mmetsp:Transcript_12133/g.29624  ORF Transcript_12133/g.29624 Transcript_12133/m.29624 type:complete len:101 (+) Transcript_12133:2840-3142(+)
MVSDSNRRMKPLYRSRDLGVGLGLPDPTIDNHPPITKHDDFTKRQFEEHVIDFVLSTIDDIHDLLGADGDSTAKDEEILSPAFNKRWDPRHCHWRGTLLL